MKKFIFVFVVLLLASGGGLYYYTQVGKTTTEGKYRFVKMDKGDLESIVSSTGMLSAIYTVQVGSQVSGTIAHLYSDFNKKVHHGDLLALIDTTLFYASVLDAQSSVDRTQAQFHQADQEFKRVKSLLDKKLASQSEYDLAVYNLESAKAGIKSSKANLQRADLNLKFCYIRAPIDGTVIARNYDVGQTVAASFSAPTLFLIANDLAKMQILANVDESDIGRIEEGQNVRFTVQAYPDKKFEGVVSQVRLQPTTVQNVVNYTVVVNVDNKEGSLLPGMTATAEFIIEHSHDILRIPNAALRFKPTQEMTDEARKNFMTDAPDSVKERMKKRMEGGGGQQQGGGGMFGGGGNRPKNMSVLYFLDDKGKLKMARVKTGITDGQMTEIKSDNENVKEGMEVISGWIVQPEAPKSSNPLQPSGQPQGGGGGGGRGR